MDRYHVVVVSKYIGEYGPGSLTAFAIADHEQANRIISNTYDSPTDAEQDAGKLNAGTMTTHADVKRWLLHPKERGL